MPKEIDAAEQLRNQQIQKDAALEYVPFSLPLKVVVFCFWYLRKSVFPPETFRLLASTGKYLRNACHQEKVTPKHTMMPGLKRSLPPRWISRSMPVSFPWICILMMSVTPDLNAREERQLFSSLLQRHALQWRHAELVAGHCRANLFAENGSAPWRVPCSRTQHWQGALPNLRVLCYL